MGYTLESYFERLELIGFFAAYPLVYALINVIAGNKEKGAIQYRLRSLLPFGYALTGLLYLGFLARNLYPDYSLSHIRSSFYHPYLKIWALSSILFSIPFLFKRPVISLLHSLVFMYLLVKDIFNYSVSSNSDVNIIRNDMKLYADSFLLNCGAFIVVFLIFYLFRKNFQKRGKG